MKVKNQMKELSLLALSGSLRRESYNTAALQALQVLAPQPIEVKLGSIDRLPLYNPDLEDENIAAVNELKSNLRKSDGLIIASPEYAHGISGPLKNALDWLVSGTEFPFKPIMLINTSPRAHHALDSLKEVLLTMSGTIVEKSFVSIPLLGSNLYAEGIIADQNISGALRKGLDEFSLEIRSQKRD
ncbi:NADPH-dependent FMN reductase [Microbulbifer rhizosphaerae]|uniref:NAD(P)H-dependent FMN reductase n=1 Tax=Microbulbifer rhizosphaerae TaxID=1562603 RepID=A0A7W4WFK8_9GAMM|nr:NAD(P)H-dependent oxidoreductase [Microbulbifer rhizosphaerae]MBB3063309.1 NAD(P)H-dependent FMN reductase [Microbulbifer rhizosphaerae]